MAMNKTAGETKKDGATAKKATPRAAPRRRRHPRRRARPGRDQEGGAKKAAGPKLTPPQTELLKKVAAHTDPAGYLAAKKPENKVLEALLKHKVIKKGKKHESGGYHYQVSNAGTEASEDAQDRRLDAQEQLNPDDSVRAFLMDRSSRPAGAASFFQLPSPLGLNSLCQRFSRSRAPPTSRCEERFVFHGRRQGLCDDREHRSWPLGR